MDEENEEWDGPWKEALDNLDLVFALLWPDVADAVDLAAGWASLEQELQKLTPDSSTGSLRVDKLFELAAKGSGDPRIAHLEVQMWKDADLPRRMFRYGIRAREHFHQPIASFALLGDDDPAWKLAQYREGVLGCEHGCTFRVAKLIEWQARQEELEAGGNLFGLFLCAHLETMATRGDVPRRQEAKFRLLANLMRREALAAEVRRWYRLIDWIMKLPEAANRAVWLRLQELKEVSPVSYVPIGEIICRENGIRESLREALEAKFPEEAATLFAPFQQEIQVDRLKFLLRAAVLAQSPEDFRTRSASSA